MRNRNFIKFSLTRNRFILLISLWCLLDLVFIIFKSIYLFIICTNNKKVLVEIWIFLKQINLTIILPALLIKRHIIAFYQLMRIIYLLFLVLPLLTTSFEVSPTCPSQTFASQCHKSSYLATLFKPTVSSLEKTPFDAPLSNINTTSSKPSINPKKFASHGKPGSLERSRSFSKKHSGGFINFVKNIPTTVSQYTYTFISKVKSLPKTLSDSIISSWIKIKHFIVIDVPSVLDRTIQKIRKLFDSFPKDFSEIEQTIMGIPHTITGNIKMLGEKAKRMMTLKTVNGTTVLREKLNMISNAWTKAEQKVLEKVKNMQNTVSNGIKNMKERIIRTFQNIWNQIINIWIKIKELLSLKAIWLQVIMCTLAIVGIFIVMYKRKRRGQMLIQQWEF